MELGIKTVKAGFFDSDKVKGLVDKAARRVLSKFGAFVRQRARSSIRSRKKPALPGQPPSSHEGSLKRLIFFAYDPAAKSVVVGPTRFREGEAPGLLEKGGRVGRKGKVQRYRGNPFMLPAAAAELPKFRESLRNMVR